MKKIISLFLCIILIANFSLTAVGSELINPFIEPINDSLFQFTNGDGTFSNPYVITNEEELIAVRFYLDSYFELGNDIELTDDWQPIGDTTSAFNGIFDGKGWKIIGLNIPAESDIVNAGLFGVTGENSVIQNLCVWIKPGGAVMAHNDAEIANTATAGGLVGNNKGSIINCHVYGGSLSKDRQYIRSICRWVDWIKQRKYNIQQRVN